MSNGDEFCEEKELTIRGENMTVHGGVEIPFHAAGSD